MNSYWIVVIPKCNDWILIEKEIRRHRDTLTKGKRLCKNRDRDWRDAATKQGSSRICDNRWKLGRSKEDFFPMAFYEY